MSMSSFKDLRARYVAGEQLSSDEASRLLRWLDDYPDERREMLIDDAIDNQLRCLARINDDTSTERFIQETIQKAVTPTDSETFQGVIQIHRNKRSRSSRLFSISVSLSAAVLVLAGLAMIWYASLERQQVDFKFAKLANSKNLSWELVDGESRHLRVSAGHGEVHFDNGTIVQLVAPVEFQLRTPASLFVKSGSVHVNVPPAAVGFTVETPLARIIDLGTKFDVDVGEQGHTQTRVRKGVVSFETHLHGLKQGDPVKLTEEGLNFASAELTKLATDIHSIATIARGSRGQFLGTFHHDGESAKFTNRRDFDDFLNRLNSPSKNTLDNTPSDESKRPSATVESSEASETQHNTSTGKGMARKMLIKQLRDMQEFHQDNPQMKSLLEGMIRQAEEAEEKIPK